MIEQGRTLKLTASWRRYWNETAILSGSERLSWGELHKEVQRYAAALAGLGLKEADVCAVLAVPGPDEIRLLLAAWSMGIIMAPLNVRQPQTVIQKQVRTIGARVLFVAEKNYPALPGIRVVPLAELAHAVSPYLGEASIDIPLSRPATLIFTSGSQGESKACLHSFANHYFNALGSNENIPLTSQDSWLLSLPLFHVAGIAILFRCLLAGATIAVPAVEHSLADAIASLRPLHISLVATQLQRLLDDTAAIEHLRAMKAILLGGSAIPEALLRRAHDLSLPIFTSYGCTEMASQISTTRPGDPLPRLLTSGRLLPYRELKIGPAGEVLLRGECLALGYWKNGTIHKLVDDHGWYHSGDCGFIDEHGFIHITGRLDNMFISGGENIHPEEIERELLKLDGVFEAIVVPVKDNEFGERPVAFVKMSKEHMSGEALIEKLKERLPKYKIPLRFFPWPSSFSMGIKPQRRQFKEAAQKLFRN